MGDWANEFKKKFEDDRSAARTNAELTLRKKQAVERSQAGFWDALAGIARDAVRDINGTDNLLLFTESGLGEPGYFKIIYNREGKQRLAEFKYFPTSNMVQLGVSGTEQGHARQEYRIAANDHEELEFRLNANSGRVDPKDIIREAIRNLLK